MSWAISNARVVTADGVFEGGVYVRDGIIQEVFEGNGPQSALDFEGDFLIPGLVELHTDNLERQFQPRPGVKWPADAAMLAHDTQMVSAGITTVCDAICVGFYGGAVERLEFLNKSLDALKEAEAQDALKADHHLHLRCEVSDSHCGEIFEPLAGEPKLKIVSLMDHTPGQRQWRDMDKYRTFHRGRTGASEDEFQELIERRRNEQVLYADKHRKAILDLLEGRDITLASHDDTTAKHVEQGHAEGVTISEFPTTVEAARAAHGHGMTNIMGAPNVILGGSHSGNVSAVELAEKGFLDGLSSDYVPISLLHAAFRLVDRLGRPLHETIRLISLNNATMAGMTDRGEIANGKRADLLRVHRTLDMPQISAVWRLGNRIG